MLFHLYGGIACDICVSAVTETFIVTKRFVWNFSVLLFFIFNKVTFPFQGATNCSFEWNVLKGTDFMSAISKLECLYE